MLLYSCPAREHKLKEAPLMKTWKNYDYLDAWLYWEHPERAEICDVYGEYDSRKYWFHRYHKGE